MENDGCICACDLYTGIANNMSDLEMREKLKIRANVLHKLQINLENLIVI